MSNSSAFHQKIRQSLADVNLQQALDKNNRRRVEVRNSAFASLPDYQELRHKAHAVRAEVVNHLERYLEQFAAQAQANGMVLHRAADAAQAVQLVIQIARQHGAKLIAKSKTMVSEEIHLNQALEAAGLRVVETDLGEYIVQLREEPPSHIITPAVHLSRADVGRLFHEKLGEPLTDEIPVMTNAARRVLREVFLSADIGLSGVNFAVAETGTLCVLTNEGNGRMVTTVPPVHIALLGIERLVPSLADLDVMLKLLPRSATGQKITVYTSLLNGPRAQGDPDGPLERHVILVDNGRRLLRDSPLQEMLYCIRCGACLNVCPVFREIGGYGYVGAHGTPTAYPGPMGSVLSPGLFGQAEFGQLARASSLCGACKEACPVDIDLPRLLLRVRAGKLAPAPPGGSQPAPKPNPPAALAVGLKLYTWAASDPLRFRLAQKLAGLLGWLARDGWLRLPAVTGWGYSKDFPAPARVTFLERLKRGAIPSINPGQPPRPAAPARAAAVPETSLPPALPRVERFKAELEALGASFMVCASEQLAGKIHAILKERRIDELLSWEAGSLPQGLLDRLEGLGVRVHHPTYQTVQPSGKVRAGLTGALAAAAETGSLALAGGAGRPLTASLLPEVHIAVLRQSDLLESVGELLHRLRDEQCSAAVLVSGPSRTADIEMTLTIGVHGPGELIVICLEEQGVQANG